jgi:hypothetical protein
VLKSYQTENAEKYYKSEKGAFTRLVPKGKAAPGLIGFYGSFVYESTYNIILEFAEMGTLEQYFQRFTPPLSALDIKDFWEQMCELIQGVIRIHHMDRDQNGHSSLCG